MSTHALVVLSGGQDSTTCLFWALLSHYQKVSAISFDYGQNHRIELESARKIAELAGVDHEVVEVPQVLVSSSPLTRGGEDLERYKSFEQMELTIGNRIEKTFVPFRNPFFLVLAANRAAAMGADTLVTGICQEDNANYCDCREDFRESMERTLTLAGGQPMSIQAPLMYLSKAQTVLLARSMERCWHALAYSHTSYDGKYPPVDNNHSNVLRAHGFEVAGLPDPLVVRAWNEGLMQLPSTSNYGTSKGDEIAYILELLMKEGAK